MIIVTPSFSKSSVDQFQNVFRPQEITKSQRFQIPSVIRAFSKSSVLICVGMDSRPNRGNTDAFSNFSGVMSTLPK